MRGTRIGTGAALLAGTLGLTGLAFAPAAVAVTPQSATITANCGAWGGGPATLTATQSGTSATITLTSSITTPLALSANSIASTLTFVNGTGTKVFSGTVNPAMAAGSAVTVGPLNGTVASGDSLQAYGGTLKMVIFGVTVTCTPSAPQSPGPFVFS
ncbi:hypothetical protein ACIQKE_08880 [Streptomyces griseoviridis]|uniref:Autotransporter n=2 Tax=Streptomyces TaxID=1883 RepID=A0A3Q9KW71_STRGD|nr:MULTISPECIES: hypothetical protein [Streptomyces]AZS87412.1 hypothetical protein ELQ87_26675 [Streptomyces griseoviridis]MDH6701684.1 hypothetical protein [Streptomyces sp. MAA16]MDT0471094.1 hypothetical protein [Streptomyces sp. DSM 41014]QCN85739.1 hypothetical protein DDJ31_12595 [Streptomyces griseoviridis]